MNKEYKHGNRNKYLLRYYLILVCKYRTQNVGGNISVAGKYIKLPKLGYVKAKISMSVNGKINNATIKQAPSGKYFCVLNVEVPDVFYSNDEGGKL